jgi:predicted small lipoprotein YifL
MRARFVTPVGALLLACSLAACGSSGDAGAFQPAGKPQSAPSTASGAPDGDGVAAPSGMTTAQIDRQVLDRYRAYQKAYERAYETNNPSGLDAYAMDPLLATIVTDLKKTAAKGEIWRFHNVFNPRIQGRSKTGATVFVIDCLQTLGASRFSAKTGKRLGSFRGGARAYQAIMRYVDGTWKISNGTEGQKC